MPVDRPDRRTFVRQLGALAATLAVVPRARAADPSPSSTTPAKPPAMNTRTIPSTREALPVIGCGTWIGFDVVDDAASLQRLASVVEALCEAGGTVLDSSPMYGRSEAITGRLLAGARAKPFVATKVWTSGREAGLAQMQESLRLLGRIDLMQVHNLLDWKTHLPTLRQWKAEGRIRSIGVTHYTPSAYRELEAVMRSEKLDFVQINYAADDREAEQRILPLAADRGMAVLVNRPFGGGDALKRLSKKPLPSWAAEIDATGWSQLLLKFVLAHPAVTCTIPGTGNPEHMRENARAGSGALPDRAFWARHADALT
jgi:diketogulonate reductase-like aldo/keto reductase